ncbi:MAG: FecR domain-containing protein [Leptospiraceae bacterium]|nr:FecR domain-containing protein [Leptospiraceae bacterium]MDW8307289.1 FecR family protein [Leptospiraceae bacterium]
MRSFSWFLLGLSGYLMAKPVGVFTAVVGKVEVREEGGRWVEARPGMKVVEKAEIQTGLKAKATIQLIHGSQVTIFPGSVVSIDRLVSGSYGTATDVNLSLGKITAVIARRDRLEEKNYFRVRTPTAVAGVRGSIQEVAYSPDSGTHVRMLEHTSEVMSRNGQKSLVPEGGAAQLSGDTMRTANQLAHESDLVVFQNAGMSEAESEFLTYTTDLTYSSAASDFTALFGLWDEILDQLLAEFGFVRITFEKL